MRALISLLVGSLMLNLSVHAGSTTKSSSVDDASEALDEDLEIKKNHPSWKKQRMEDNTRESGTRPGFEKHPGEYRPNSTPQERIQTED